MDQVVTDEMDDDLFGYVNEILTLLCVRRYGPRAAADRPARDVTTITTELITAEPS